ncbi:GspE/PulE family protein [Verrucomicrobiales bacterium]|jgi:type IV pilus assembly protein PilB|nr:GspE/PulE family protein [Verrucomicrobiales bacterium]MDB2495620.1 GspE/PulE family protein [Verrucomicrobiales bacterium]MDB3941354.1 GspE/PulE family protein [Verrucomicrobiales bacterium]
MTVDSVIDLLVSRGLIDESQRQEYISAVYESEHDVTQAVEDLGVIQRDQLFHLVAQDIGGEYYDLAEFEPAPQVLKAIPAGTAKLYQAFPIQFLDEGLQVVIANPLDPQNLEELGFTLNQQIIPAVAPPEQISALIETHYYGGGEGGVEGTGAGESDALAAIRAEVAALSEDDLDEESNSAPIIRYVDLVLYQAIKEKASDIHFEPFEDDFKIRYRVDGALYEMAPPPQHLKQAIISRIKVMSALNIAETRLPQDGRITKEINEQPIDMRVSTLPTAFGESVVLRVLDRANVNLDLENLNLQSEVYDYIQDTIVKPNGIFICTGPTGAGKTTTLYACLRKVNTEDSKLLTAEDPVEYDIDGIMQVPVNEAIGMTFGKVLRAFLRQDPDRILVGEMRDLETAQIAIQASLTGHLVLSTLHTNDAPGAVTRLVDMGCEPFMVAATLEGVLGQRLLRRICDDCRVAYQPTSAVLAQLGLSEADTGGREFYTGQGCDSCNDTGYKGRQGLFELLDMTDPIRDLVAQRAATVIIKQKAQELGMKTLREDGLRNIFDGITTIEEVLKYT